MSLRYEYFDVCLQRATLVGQVAIFLIAAFTIFYTVIPLYQQSNLGGTMSTNGCFDNP